MTKNDTDTLGMSEFGLLDLWGPLRAAMEEHLLFSQIKRIVALAGLDMSKISHLSQQKGYRQMGDTKGTLMTAIDGEYGRLPAARQKQFLIIVAEKAAELNPELLSDLDEMLHQLGWQYVQGQFLPIKVLEEYDLESVAQSARPDLLKAATRFRDGDLDGALTAACGAVDSACGKVYGDMSLGDPAQANSFQEKVSRAVDATDSLGRLERDLVSLGWPEHEATKLRKNLKGSLNQAAYVMQTLRSRMSDAHGSKETLRPVVFDSIKWAMIITSLLG